MDVAAPSSANTAWLLREFTDIRSTLERTDANLTAWERHGNTYPNRSVASDFDRVALRLDSARSELQRALPSATDLHARLQGDVLWLSRTAGKIDLMAQTTTTFGSGWNRTLDQSIRDATTAVDLLIGSTTAG